MSKGITFSRGGRKALVAMAREQSTTVDAQSLVEELEAHASRYDHKVARRGIRPAVESWDRAGRITAHANELFKELANLDDMTRRRMRSVMKGYEDGGDAPRVSSRARLAMCAGAAEDVLFASSYARDEAWRQFTEGEGRADRIFREFCSNVARAWRRATGARLPALEYDRDDDGRGYRSGARVVVSDHPLWVVLDAVGVKVDSNTLEALVDFARGEDRPRVRRRRWRQPVYWQGRGIIHEPDEAG